MATLEDSTFSEKHFLSNLTESAAASTASVRTGTWCGVLQFNSTLTLVNAQGMGTTFAFGYAHDPDRPGDGGNEHESLNDLRGDVEFLYAAVREWSLATLGALDDLKDAAGE